MPSLEPTTFQLIAGSLIMVMGSLLQASIGFGIALFVVPLLVLLNPAFVPGPMLFASLFLAAIMGVRGRSAIDRPKLSYALGGLFLGTVVAASGLAIIPADWLPKLFGILILAAVAISASGVHVSLTKVNLIFAGVVSGIMGTVAGIHGPPIALLYQREAGPIVRTTLAVFFFLAYSAALLALGSVGLFGWGELLAGFAIAPGVIGGYLIARFTTRLLDKGHWLRIAILIVAALSAISLIFRP
jgi:uncharacterized membrane protein YfcA